MQGKLREMRQTVLDATRAAYELAERLRDAGNFRDLDALNTAQAPSWQPDGIVYQASTGLEITADKPVVETKALIQAPYYQDPTWQPNGNRVLFQSREGSHERVTARRASYRTR